MSLNHAYRRINLAWLMSGILLSNSVHTSRIANKIPGKAKRVSRTRRLSRFLNNIHFRPRTLYEPIARQLLQAASGRGLVRLIIDSTQVAGSHQLMMVALAFRRRALPIAWSWVRYPKGHTSTRHQKALLSYVHDLMPQDAKVILTGDSEFGGLQPVLDLWKWHFALRQKGNYLFQENRSLLWQKINTVDIKRGKTIWFTDCLLTKTGQYPVNLLLYWHKNEKRTLDNCHQSINGS